jgi:hypothetical protein
MLCDHCDFKTFQDLNEPVPFNLVETYYHLRFSFHVQPDDIVGNELDPVVVQGARTINADEDDSACSNASDDTLQDGPPVHFDEEA